MTIIIRSNFQFFITKPSPGDPGKSQPLQLLPRDGHPTNQEMSSKGNETADQTTQSNHPPTNPENNKKQESNLNQANSNNYLPLKPVSKPKPQPLTSEPPIEKDKRNIDKEKTAKIMFICSGIFGAIGLGATIPLISTAVSDSNDKAPGLIYSGVVLGSGLALGLIFFGLGKYFQRP